MSLVKYIVFDNGEPEIHCFPGEFEHRAEANRIGLPVLSAAFVIGNRCVGESLSLGVVADEERDTALLREGKILEREAA